MVQTVSALCKCLRGRGSPLVVVQGKEETWVAGQAQNTEMGQSREPEQAPFHHVAHQARTFTQTPHQPDLEEEGFALHTMDSTIASLGSTSPTTETGPCMVPGVSLCPARKVPAPPCTAEKFCGLQHCHTLKGQSLVSACPSLQQAACEFRELSS